MAWVPLSKTPDADGREFLTIASTWIAVLPEQIDCHPLHLCTHSPLVTSPSPWKAFFFWERLALVTQSVSSPQATRHWGCGGEVGGTSVQLGAAW